jgi:hypothetical protein
MFLVNNIMKLEQMYLKLIEKVFVRKDVFSMDTVVASLLLVVSATPLACVVVNYAINGSYALTVVFYRFVEIDSKTVHCLRVTWY